MIIMKKGDKTLKLLELVKEMSLDMADLMDAFISSGYGASLDKIQRKAADGSFRNRFDNISKEEKKKVNDRFYSMVSRLEKDGLMERSKKDKSSFFKITNKGIDKIGFLKNKKKRMIETPSCDYDSKKSNRVTIVMFDVPEKQRTKRRWLRSALSKMEFEMIQKSVWMGKVVIPREFLDDMRMLDMTDYIEIFEITKTGSLKQIN